MQRASTGKVRYDTARWCTVKAIDTMLKAASCTHAHHTTQSCFQLARTHVVCMPCSNNPHCMRLVGKARTLRSWDQIPAPLHIFVRQRLAPHIYTGCAAYLEFTALLWRCTSLMRLGSAQDPTLAAGVVWWMPGREHIMGRRGRGE